jgi:hypothetical protein
MANTGEKRMRAILFAMLIALGVALVGTSNVSAAPAGGAAIGEAAAATDITGQVQHWRWGSGGFYGHNPRRSHWRRGSGGPVCRTVCRHREWNSVRVCSRVC